MSTQEKNDVIPHGGLPSSSTPRSYPDNLEREVNNEIAELLTGSHPEMQHYSVSRD